MHLTLVAFVYRLSRYTFHIYLYYFSAANGGKGWIFFDKRWWSQCVSNGISCCLHMLLEINEWIIYLERWEREWCITLSCCFVLMFHAIYADGVFKILMDFIHFVESPSGEIGPKGWSNYMQSSSEKKKCPQESNYISMQSSSEKKMFKRIKWYATEDSVTYRHIEISLIRNFVATLYINY